ncbi:MAG: HNH endonuclease [Lachnospiraceae bacterium]|nr:HNH endonuclease [Lachnospiraceae bacterium]
MKQEISEYYKKKGYDKLYVAVNKEPRRVATLRKPNKEMASMSYAKYLYTSHYECDIADGDQIDHINGDRMDDRIENLQVISKHYNIKKDKVKKEMLLMKCPVCGEKFLFPKRNLSTHPNPCCSRRCGGIKSHWK